MKIFTLPLVATCFRISLLFILLINMMPAQSQVRMRANLYIVDNNGATLMDGNMTNYSATYSNAVDGYDIWKMSNFGENFGILRSAANLVIERRSLITISDTTYFRMWNVQVRNYRIRVIAENLHTFNLVAVLRDKYLSQDIPVALNDTTDINFAVTSQAGSYAQDRFQLIYTNVSASGSLPVTFTSVQAQRKGGNINVSWSVENEISMQKYVVEYSADGLNFKDQQDVLSRNNSVANSYTVTDSKTTTGDHYYRIKGLSKDGKAQYSSIARVGAGANGEIAEDINVYPNPVSNKSMNLQINATVAGTYQLTVVETNGRMTALPAIKLTAGKNQQKVNLPKTLAAGIYRLKVNTPDNKILLKTITVL